MTVAVNSLPLLVQKPIPRPIVEASSIPATQSGADADARQLSASVTRGDATAFRQLYDRYHGRLLRFALVLGHGDEVLAQDIVQSVFVIAASKLGRVESENHLWNWLARVARQQLAKTRRQKHKDGAAFDTTDALEYPDAPKPDTILEECLNAALLTMDAEEKQLVEWFYFDGLSHKEIAERLEITPKAVSSQLERARIKLRSLMKRRLSHES